MTTNQVNEAKSHYATALLERLKADKAELERLGVNTNAAMAWNPSEGSAVMLTRIPDSELTASEMAARYPAQQPAPATGKALTTNAELRKELKLAKVKALRGKYKATPIGKITPDDFLAYVRKHPGLRAEEVAKGLGAKKLPMVAIRNALGKKLKTKGARRGMRYWVR